MPTKKNSAQKKALASASATAKKTNPASKKSRANVAASSAQALAAKSAAHAEQSAQPGVIASIMETLAHAKATEAMLTVNEIVGILQKKFPTRTAEGMTITVRSQLSRLPREKEFKVRKLRDGRVVRYAAA